jgi:transcription elongation factor GreA
MTTRPSLASARIGQVRDDFLHSDAGQSLNPDDASRLRKFVTWCGISTSIEAVPPFKIEEFLQHQTNTSNPPRNYIALLKAFFGHAHKQGLVSANPMTAVRLPRGAGGTTKRAATTHASASSSAPRAQSKNADVVYVSRPQLASMQADLERLRTEERHKISQMLHDAIKDGDLSENAAYDDAKMRQGMLEARIRELEQKLRNVELIEDQDRSGGGVAVGSHIAVLHVAANDTLEFQVVGPEETDPRAGKISHLSPLGKALMGKGPGDEVEIATPSGAHRYRIVSVD